MFNKNIIRYFEDGKIGNCPVCGRELDIRVATGKIRDTYIVICDNCEKSEHFIGTIKNV